jgi:3-deoxy-D-manno-octulosonate 8-phosphate phosphatase (KDO 8-P phosphatase)
MNERNTPLRDEPFRIAGGDFVATPATLSRKLAGVKALIFDWDGVFGTGGKGGSGSGGFNETDSMGVNMLRYGLWRREQRLAVTAIVSGEDNRDAIEFAEREHLQAIYLRVPDKRLALRHLCESHDLAGDEVAFVFDDINDLGIAGECGLRCLVRRAASPLFRDYVVRRGLCEYVTANDASGHAVREIAEMLLGQMGVYDEVVGSRAAFDAEYRTFFAARQTCATEQFGVHEGRITTAPSR